MKNVELTGGIIEPLMPHLFTDRFNSASGQRMRNLARDFTRGPWLVPMELEVLAKIILTRLDLLQSNYRAAATSRVTRFLIKSR